MRYFTLSFLCHVASLLVAQEISPRYELVKINDNINTRYNEVSPVISPDGKRLYYFVANHPENTYGKDKDGSQDIWVSSLDEKGQWSKGKHAGSPLNQNRFNQVFNFMPDGSLFIRGGRSKNEKGFSIVGLGGSWNELKVTDFDKMDKGLFNGATISDDGKNMILYFSEKERDKYSDLYLSIQQPDGHFSKPAKLKFSSPGDDYSPFLAPDQKTLYFSSNRFTKERIGASDIYKVVRLDDTWQNWSDPVNLGKAINTGSDDAYFSIDTHGNIFTARAGVVADGGNFDLFILKPKNIKVTLVGVIHSEKTDQLLPAVVEVNGKDQKMYNSKSAVSRFEVRLPEEFEYTVSASAPGFLQYSSGFRVPPKLVRDTVIRLQINMVPIAKQLTLVGQVLNKKTNNRVSNAKVNMAYKNDGSVGFDLAVSEGKYKQDIASLGWYVFNVTAEGYLNAVDSVLVDNAEQTPIEKNLLLIPIEVGLTVRLKNIYFDFDKTTLKSESFVELNKVVDFLKQNAKVSIEIAGHTDSKGSDTYNENLSQGRSQSVVDYLVSQGIEVSRLEAHGYGESKPIDSNDTDEGRANNRRVEFTVLKM